MNVDFDSKAIRISGPAAAGGNPVKGQKSPCADAPDFQQILQEKLSGQASVSLSKHASRRVHERQINLDPNVMDQLSTAVDIAEQKGIRDALILGGEAAFIVNIPSRTIITTVSSEEMNQAVFTNIDGTVLL